MYNTSRSLVSYLLYFCTYYWLLKLAIINRVLPVPSLFKSYSLTIHISGFLKYTHNSVEALPLPITECVRGFSTPRDPKGQLNTKPKPFARTLATRIKASKCKYYAIRTLGRASEETVKLKQCDGSQTSIVHVQEVCCSW